MIAQIHFILHMIGSIESKRVCVCVHEPNIEECIAPSDSMHDNFQAILNDFVILSDVDRFSWSNPHRRANDTIENIVSDFVYSIYVHISLALLMQLSLLSIMPIALLLSSSAPEVLGFRFIIYLAHSALLFRCFFSPSLSCAPHEVGFIREFHFACWHNYVHVSYM